MNAVNNSLSSAWNSRNHDNDDDDDENSSSPPNNCGGGQFGAGGFLQGPPSIF